MNPVFIKRFLKYNKPLVAVIGVSLLVVLFLLVIAVLKYLEMVAANNLIKYDDRKYIITDTGKMIVEELSRNIPLTVREKAIKAVEEYFSRMKSEKENKVTIRKNANGYDVTCSVLDGNFEMMKLKLYAPDILAATTIKNNFYKNPSEIYSELLYKLTFLE